MFDIALLILAIGMFLLIVAGIICIFIAVCKDKRKVYKITYNHIRLINEYNFVTYVYATNIVRAAHEIQNKAYVIRSIEEVKDD